MAALVAGRSSSSSTAAASRSSSSSSNDKDSKPSSKDKEDATANQEGQDDGHEVEDDISYTPYKPTKLKYVSDHLRKLCREKPFICQS